MRTRIPTPIPDGLGTPRRDTPAKGRRMAWVVVAAVLGLIVGGAIVAAVTQDRLDDRATEIVDARTEIAAQAARIADLEGRLDTGDEAAARIARQLAAARDDLTTWVGPALADGRHFVFVVATGTTQDPPRLIVDDAMWFTGAAADRAARQDGVLPDGQTHIENGYYIRNEDPAWRTLPLDPAAPVSVVVYPYGDIDDPAVVTMASFERMIERDPWMLRLPYWLDVRDGVVTAIEQQFIP